jgi:hypothetical protein
MAKSPVCDITVLKVHTPKEDKISDIVDSFSDVC